MRDIHNTLGNGDKLVMSEVFLYDLKEEKFIEMIPDNPHHRS